MKVPAVLVFLAACVCCSSAYAQSAPPIELFAGYQLVHVPGGADGGHPIASGWDAAFSATAPSGMGIEAEASGFYRSGITGCCLFVGYPAPPTSTADALTFLVGPHVRLARTGRGADPYFHALFGTGRVADVSQPVTHFSMTWGGGVDFQLQRALAIRVSADYLYLVDWPTGNLNTFRISTGIVFRFGGK